MQLPTTLFLPPQLYVEDPNHKMLREHLSEQEYAAAIGSFVIVCADVMIINRALRRCYLACRKALPWNKPWIIGGRVLAGESELEAIVRKFRQETGVEIAPERFQYLRMNRYRWALRQQAPQEVGSDNLAYTFFVELTPEELAYASQHLDHKEYETWGFRGYDSAEELEQAGVHPALIDMYRQVFPI